MLNGWAKICVVEEGREAVIAERGPGDLVGEQGTAPGNVRSASVIALGTVRALVMTTAARPVLTGGYRGGSARQTES